MGHIWSLQISNCKTLYKTLDSPPWLEPSNGCPPQLGCVLSHWLQPGQPCLTPLHVSCVGTVVLELDRCPLDSPQGCRARPRLVKPCTSRSIPLEADCSISPAVPRLPVPLLSIFRSHSPPLTGQAPIHAGVNLIARTSFQAGYPPPVDISLSHPSPTPPLLL